MTNSACASYQAIAGPLKTLYKLTSKLKLYAVSVKTVCSLLQNLAGHTTKCFAPSCSSRDSASDDISGLKNGGPEAKPVLWFLR